MQNLIYTSKELAGTAAIAYYKYLSELFSLSRVCQLECRCSEREVSYPSSPRGETVQWSEQKHTKCPGISLQCFTAGMILGDRNVPPLQAVLLEQCLTRLEHTGEVQVSITAILPWTLSVVGLVSPPTGMSCRCVVSATVWVKPAEFSPHSARDSVAGNCTCPEQLHFWQETSHYTPFTTYSVRLVWRTWVWEQGDKDSYHVNWKGDTNIHQCLK